MVPSSNRSDILQQLRDIHLPPVPGIWPLAPGWYVLLGLVVLVLLLGSWYGWRQYRHGLAKRAGLKLLEGYANAYTPHVNTQQTSAAIVDVLKRVALAYFPRERVAQLHGQAWLTFLNDTSVHLDFFAEQNALLIAPYQSGYVCDLTRLLSLARLWIKQRRVTCLS
ncbi:MAG: hypothetical protein CK424_05945 [Legionella sp.]|nr:MAG: hypothetical protein CK424_05945 [Legionella sp.]